MQGNVDERENRLEMCQIVLGHMVLSAPAEYLVGTHAGGGKRCGKQGTHAQLDAELWVQVSRMPDCPIHPHRGESGRQGLGSAEQAAHHLLSAQADSRELALGPEQARRSLAGCQRPEVRPVRFPEVPGWPEPERSPG